MKPMNQAEATEVDDKNGMVRIEGGTFTMGTEEESEPSS